VPLFQTHTCNYTPQKHAEIVILCQTLEHTHTDTTLMSGRHSNSGLFNLGLADYSNYVKEKSFLEQFALFQSLKNETVLAEG